MPCFVCEESMCMPLVLVSAGQSDNPQKGIGFVCRGKEH